MALTKQQKTAQITEFADLLKKSQSLMFANYAGLTVANTTKLRRDLKASKSEMKVVKKTLLAIAAKNAGFPEVPESMLNGAVACILSYEDPMSGAQAAFKFAKDNPQVSLIGGIFDGKVLTKEEAIAFAKMPTRQQLLGMFAMMLRAPLQNFAGIVSSPLRQFAIAVGEVAKKKSS